MSRSDITTQDVSVYPQYVWDSVRNEQKITGYTFSQRLQVHWKRMARNGRVLCVGKELVEEEGAGKDEKEDGLPA